MLSEAFFSPGNWIIWLAILWSLPWKGMALWKSAKRGKVWWFIALFLINTVGLLDMVYLFIISERRRPIASRKNRNQNGGAA
ncbi:hypothetical protein COU12_01100 [Candidatus Jorgensenbacteria bacterium CG10_big_fil_rev_8_21_14_0_10_54_38]|uniref:DUF5652 domain-containing protein n=1 Tax=Candidatus Jorgensenbacteria bacterium CG10_big_fil_rev_8_21_14_0_10_54_38 TaxID=1974593 RepID=A0A2M6WG69_9BACT|nr:MAG: hypothetical protein COU12_01100 [Candidatus Jorgensenbacteria bacterium CG10_big_fil_rev_8_21_14_0_10_54_38]